MEFNYLIPYYIKVKAFIYRCDMDSVSKKHIYVRDIIFASNLDRKRL